MRLAAFLLSPILFVGVFFLIQGFRADASALTADGYLLKNFYYVMGCCFSTLSLAVLVAGSILTIKNNSRGKNKMKTRRKYLLTRITIDDGKLNHHEPQIFDTQVHANIFIRDSGVSGQKYLIQEIDEVE